MIFRQAKFSAITVLCALIAMSTLGCHNSGQGFKFAPNFAMPKFQFPHFPCKLKQPKVAPESGPTCGCDACQRASASLPQESLQTFEQIGPSCESCPISAGDPTIEPFSAYPTAPVTSQPLNEYDTPEPREQFGPYDLEGGDFEVPQPPSTTPTPTPTPTPPPTPTPEPKELFIVPEDGQFRPSTNDNSFQVRSKPQPSFRKTVTSPVKKALTSTGDIKPMGDLKFNDFKPVDLSTKTNELKAAVESANMDLKANAQQAQTDLANELAPLTFQAPPTFHDPPVPPMNDPIEEMIDEIPEAAEIEPAPVPETRPEPAMPPAPKMAAELPAPAPAPVPAPLPAPTLPEPAMPPAPKMAADLPAPPRFEVEVGEEIYGAILFDKRIEDNLQKEDRLNSGTALNLKSEIDVPASKVQTAPVAKVEIASETHTVPVTRIHRPAAERGVIHIRRQASPQTDPVVLRAFSNERSINPTLRPRPNLRSNPIQQVTQVSTGRATAPVTTLPKKAEGEFIIKSLPAPPVDPSESEPYKFRSVPNFQIPVLRATLPSGAEQSRVKIRVDSPGHSNSSFCESCATKLHDDIGPMTVPANPQTDQQPQQQKPAATQQQQQQQQQQQSMYFEREANSNALAYPTLR